MGQKPRGFLIAFFAAMLVLGLASEVGYRIWTYRTYAVNAAYTVATQDFPYAFRMPFEQDDVLGIFPPYASHTLRQYAIDGTLARSARVTINNLGWVAFDDYVEKKPPGEFRIAFLGDSLTASVTNDLPWPTVVQRELRKTSPNVTVLNLGKPGMSTQLIGKITVPIAQRMSADMVIVNMPIENTDFPLLPRDWKRDLSKPPPPPLTVGDIQVPLLCPPGSRDCSVSPAWNVPARRELSPEEVNLVKRRAARMSIRRRLLRDFRPMLFRQDGVSQSISTATREERISAAAEALLAIKRAYPNLIVTINPLEWYYDPATLPPITADLLAGLKAAGLDVIDMRDRMPAASAAERHRWYNMPHDGHWSDYGAEVYGRAIAKVIEERRPITSQ